MSELEIFNDNSIDNFEENKITDALKSGASGLKNKFEQTDWHAAEQNVNDFTKMVFICLKEFTSDKLFSETTKRSIVLGEEFYCAIRELLYENEFKLIKTKPKQIKKENVKNKKNKKKRD